MPHYDVVILGAGAAGMMAAIEAGKRGRQVLVVDHAKYAGEKIRISGGGRCNFTNINATTDKGRDRFLSQNPRFALSALSRYTPDMFIAFVRQHGIAFHEKTLGQLFCDGPATQVITMLLGEMRKVTWPTRDEVKKATIAIVLFVAALGLAIGLMDSLFQAVLVKLVARLF